MEKIYDTQDYLRINLYYEADVSDSIASVIIKYIDPEEDEGVWEASHNAEEQIIYYDLPVGSPLAIPGDWYVWSVAIMDDGRILPGTVAKFRVYEEGLVTCIDGNCY